MARSVSDYSISVVTLCLVGAFLALAGRLVFVQCFRNDPTLGNLDTLLSNSRNTRLVHLDQRRGNIYDRAHVPLTTEHRYYEVFVDAKALQPEYQRDAVTNIVSWFPEHDTATLDSRLTFNRENNRRYYVVGTTTDDVLAEYVRSLGRPGKPLRGLAVKERYEREYPMGSAASHVVGFINKEDVGVTGIEMKFNSMRTGAPGHVRVSVNALGREIRHLRDGYLAPRNGVDIELTIDTYLQNEVDSLIDEAWRTTQSTAAWALVYDCRTGEVLAMADRPTVDPVNYGTDLESWKNRCVAFRYEPGSVMKPVTICGALTAGVISTNTVIDTGHGPFHFGGYALRDHFDGPGHPRDFIRKSSNKGTAMIALKMGRELLADTVQRAGFGSRTGIELPAEDRGNIGRPDKWTELNLTRISIGQSIDVTAIQLAAAYGAIANGGIRMRPHIVRRILAPETGKVLRDFHPEASSLEPIFSPKATRDMLEMLESVTTVDPGTRAHGTGRRAAVPGYRVGGKTGTAQMLIDHHYSSSAYHASFCGILPIDDPRYIIVVTLQHPIGLHGGGDVAAPVFSKIATQVARYYGLPTALYQEDVFDLGTPDPDPEGLLDPFTDRNPEDEPNFLDIPEPDP